MLEVCLIQKVKFPKLLCKSAQSKEYSKINRFMHQPLYDSIRKNKCYPIYTCTIMSSYNYIYVIIE